MADASGIRTHGWHSATRAITRFPGLTALILGVIAALGFPPLHLWPLTLLTMGALGAMIRAAPTRRAAFWLGWMFGMGHFTLANNWIATAFTFQDQMPAMLGWLAVPLLSVYLAVYPALATWGSWELARRAKNGGPLPFAALFAGCWIITEWLRSWVFTGYVWDPLGLVFLGGFDSPGIAVLLPVLGTYALSGLVVLLAGWLWFALTNKRWITAGVSFLVITISMFVPGFADREPGTIPFTLVQPDLRQPDLDDPSKFEAQFTQLANLSAPRDDSAGRLVLWPESAVPDYLEDGYPQRFYDRMTAGGNPEFARLRIGQAIGGDAMVLTGAVGLNIAGEGESRRVISARNSVIALNSEGEIVGSYAKAHLVPYGEYLALRWLLEPLGATRLVAGTLDFEAGPGPQTLALGKFGKAGVQICYEIIFSGQVIDSENRPDYIFNPSNDGWFGAFGPPQHLAQARMRAIEEGLPVLRSTTTGISAVIDANGIVREHIGMHRADRIDGRIPPAKSPTLFARLGNILPLGWAMLAIIAALLTSYVARRRTTS